MKTNMIKEIDPVEAEAALKLLEIEFSYIEDSILAIVDNIKNLRKRVDILREVVT